jgi:sorting nexin-8
MKYFQSQRDLYIAMRDLFIRHDRLSIDQVERLRKRVETNSLKLEGIKAVQKDGWQDEADRIIGVIEKDQAMIGAQLNRRVFIRAWCVHTAAVLCLFLIFVCQYVA